MKIVVAGYYGCGNLGDDALLLGLLNGLDIKHEVTVLSGNPVSTKRTFSVNAVPRKNIGEAAVAIRSADALVFGGGGLLQDTTSLLSLMYYTHLIGIAAKAKKKVALLGQGLGPIRSMIGKRAAARAFTQCHLITTRDEGSMRLVERLASHSKAKRLVTDDLAWLCSTSAQPARRKAIAISARPWKSETPKIVTAFQGFCRRAAADGWEILPAALDRTMDDAVLDQIAPSANIGAKVETPGRLIENIAQAGATVAMRLHAGIFSVANGIAPTLVSYDDKVATFAQSIGQPALTLDKLTEDSLWEAFQYTEQNRQALEAEGRVRREAGVRRARMNLEMLESLLQSGRTEPRV
ncbi:MAG: polysaccharide pyruvyl transferase CsaB [Armatimonadota bacterium]|nr:polysaccharide pyruvyl transferase CsaB [Armatimonadota bacterium]